MKLLSILDYLGTADAPTGPAPRRHLLRQLGQAGVRVAAAALPLALATPALAKPTDTALDGLLLLLRQEDLLVAFYTRFFASPLVQAAPAVSFVADFDRMMRQQQGHAQFLRDTLTAAGVTPPPATATSAYDFSGRKNNPANPELFPGVFTDFYAFLQLAQQLEDATAAIYLGQLITATNDRQLLDAVVRMQAVAARHASHLRTVRRTVLPATAAAAVKSWPSTADPALPFPILVPAPAGGSGGLVSIYAFEANQTQGLAPTAPVPYATLLTGATAVQTRALAEAFDEPLPTYQTVALQSLFI